MKKILFDARAWCLNVLPKMADQFSAQPDAKVETVMVYHNTVDYKKYRRNETCENLADYYAIGTKKYSKADIEAIEKKYGLTNLWNVVYYDRFLRNKGEDYIIGQISYYVYTWEEILKKHQPDYIVTETVTGLWNYILYALSGHYQCTYLGILFTKNTNKYFFSRDVFGSFPEMIRKFDRISQSGASEEERAQTARFLDSFRNKHIEPVYMQFTSTLPKVHNFFNPYRISINVYKDIRLFLLARNDYKIDYRFQGYQRDLTRLWRMLYIKLAGIFAQPDYQDRYVLFPLHYQPEASTDICAAYYADQYNVIVNLVRSLPFGYKLYVKEHYAVLGSKSLGFYKKVKSLPNVKLINPWVPVNDLIRNAQAIAVLTGTTGLEGIILKKPVIIFGHVFYDIYPGLYKVTNLETLPDVILEALHRFSVDERMYENYMSAYVNSGYQGRMHGYNFSKEEIALHCQNLMTEIGLA